jgi:hypothetical protein
MTSQGPKPLEDNKSGATDAVFSPITSPIPAHAVHISGTDLNGNIINPLSWVTN